MTTTVIDANRELVASVKIVEAKLDSLQTSMNRQTTLISIVLSVVGLAVAAAVALGPMLARAVH